MKKLLAAIIILVALVSLSLGLTMVFTESHGSPFPGLLALLGELLLAAANILVLLLNLLYWKLYGAPRWLRIVIWIQVVPALATLALVSVQIYQNWQQGRAYDQRISLFETIRADRIDDLAEKQKQCGEQCSGLYSLNEQLLDAADANAYRVAQKLIGEHARVSSKLGQAGRTLDTCEGDALIAINALELAVAGGNPKMVHLLLPASDASARHRALWRERKGG